MTFSGRARTMVLAGMTASLAVVALSGHHHPSRPSPPPVVIYEDGSGVQYQGDSEVKTFPEGTFVWNCHRMGNRICGKP